jgi:hypothetical protein
MSRSTILGKLRRLARPDRAPSLPPELPSFPRYPDPVFEFQSELERVAGIFLDGRTPERLAAAFGTVLQESGSKEIYWEGRSPFAQHGIAYRLRNPDAFNRGHLVFSKHPQSRLEFPVVLYCCPCEREIQANVVLCVSGAVCGIAETGTVVESARNGTGRLLPVLAPMHVSLLREQDLLMNHAVFFSQLKPGEEGSHLVLVTGPSRTADIEKTLVLGVHGPQRHYVILT